MRFGMEMRFVEVRDILARRCKVPDCKFEFEPSLNPWKPYTTR